MNTFQCTQCSASVAVPQRVKTVSCRRCGDVSFVNDGATRRVYPALQMLPIDQCPQDYPLSKWMLPWTRPLVPGNYHLRFRHTEPQVFVAWWDGVSFRAPDGQRIRMGQFLTWRGVMV